MEGVVVRAKKGIVTVSVVSNAKGEFSFPAAKLEPVLMRSASGRPDTTSRVRRR